ncbi:hypothetical protein HCN44_001950 [Aphidius gifuensis]|uniref:Large ribosomal subunit protein mL54 n=1 Tax=Aphidius gifuensis TaxID=684658 RepID=A0A835CWG0_APHGI|nr:39S ribosomal protein L54, mitochondrial [Aphidius gifuensis]KAF7996318.1 hypothetical protein HCN44_001950 [Aphidius gifuensis]
MTLLLSLIRQTTITTAPLHFVVSKCGYAAPASAVFSAKAKKAKKAAGSTKIVLPVETDTKKLVEYVCGSNILKEGEDVKLKDDSEYPDWLWNIYLGEPKKLEELDPNTKAYWRKLREKNLRRNNRLIAGKKF